MNGLSSSVNRFRYRIGATAVFDADDARQEASIAMWLAGDDRAVVGYRAILDALRKLVPGFRQHDQIICSEVEDMRTHEDSPEAILSAWQTVDAIERGEVPKPEPVQATPEPEEDPAYAALRAEARAASLLYSQAMR